MSPSHTTRKAGRYRYYVSQAVLQGRKKDLPSVARIGADDLERAVVDAIRDAMSDKHGFADDAAIRNVISNGHAPSHGLGGHHDQAARDMVKRHVERIVIHATEIEILLRRRDIARSDPAGVEVQVLRVPLERRARDRKEIIVPGGDRAPPRSLDHSLVLTVSRGRAWVAALCRGEYADTAEIASKCDLGESYVRRMLRLAFLAPDIVEAIAEGRQPRGLTLQRLLAPLPLTWRDQRREFGFAP